MQMIKYFGIRHHGVGSARNLKKALADFQPDVILLECPPEAESLLSFVPNLKPPVAILAYQSDQPQNAVYYPFVEFSPEWQAMQYSVKNNIPCRFFDLPLAHVLAEKNNPETPEEALPVENQENIVSDPFDHLAKISGYENGEVWWDAMIESCHDKDVFEAVNLAISALREALPEATSQKDLIREEQMRQVIKENQRAKRLAVVCGAWHVPALSEKSNPKLLKNLPKVKVETTWIPWTHQRLTLASGYGAGIVAPNWYHHLWHNPEDDGVEWLSLAGKHLRDKNHEFSSAYIIEALRLAQAYSSIQNRHQPTLSHYWEALRAVVGMGEDSVLASISDKWLVGHVVGAVPSEVPQLPLVIDVANQRKKLRILQDDEIKDLKLDLRKETDLKKSVFLHRLNLLKVGWTELTNLSGEAGKGSFREEWQIQYTPEGEINLIEKALYGTTLNLACHHYVRELLEKETQLSALIELLVQIIPADLPETISELSLMIANLSVHNRSLTDILKSIPNLAYLIHYGSVQNFDAEPLKALLNTLLTRMGISAWQECFNIDEDLAEKYLNLIRKISAPLDNLQDETLNALWIKFLNQLIYHEGISPLIVGGAMRLLFDKNVLDFNLFPQHLSPANESSAVALWLEGFLSHAGTLLLVNQNLWQLLNDWLISIEEELFVQQLPLLRRTFSTFSPSEKRRIGEKLAQKPVEKTELKLDFNLSALSLQTVGRLL